MTVQKISAAVTYPTNRRRAPWMKCNTTHREAKRKRLVGIRLLYSA